MTNAQLFGSGLSRLGKEVAKLVNEWREAGRYSITFDGSKLASGVYIYQLRINDFMASKKFILMK